jgi:hypothetical protein
MQRDARFEWHYTPEHGSWLNVAEIELSVLERRCLARRMNRAQLAREVPAWEACRNALQGTLDWQFTIALVPVSSCVGCTRRCKRCKVNSSIGATTQQETVGIDEKMSLSSFDTLSRIITNSVLFFRPFFSAVLTDWLSRTAAEGVGSRPALTRRRSRSTS